MTMLKKALEEWKYYGRYYHYLDKCCNGSHLDAFNNWLRDDQVCERERAWRRYVRLRDSNHDFPFRTFNREVRADATKFVNEGYSMPPEKPNVSQALILAIKNRNGES